MGLTAEYFRQCFICVNFTSMCWNISGVPYDPNQMYRDCFTLNYWRLRGNVWSFAPKLSCSMI